MNKLNSDTSTMTSKPHVRAKILWECGSTEVKEFETRQDRSDFIKRHTEMIVSYKLSTPLRPIWTQTEIKEAEFYCPMRNWSDYEMDMYL